MRAGALAAMVLCVGLTSAALGQEPAPLEPEPVKKTKGSWVSWLWPFGAKKKAEPPVVVPVQTTASKDIGESVQSRERAALLRRQDVCLKLREIADSTNDDALRRRAEDLDERAWNVYLRRTSGLPGSDPGLELDERMLEHHLRPGTVDAGSLQTGGRGPGSGATGRAALRGGNQ